MPRDCGPKPDDPVELTLWHFAKQANFSLLHASDERRFDEFTVTAYENGNQWQEKDVERRLLGYGMADELVKRLLNRFEIGISVLHKRKMIEQEAKSTSN
jgi:hypothetical protein